MKEWVTARENLFNLRANLAPPLAPSEVQFEADDEYRRHIANYRGGEIDIGWIA
jgi:hypothetical protein